MPKRQDIQSILVIGAGPIVIGQACEFDYSGTQACRALKQEGFNIVLINSNPATIMTDPSIADSTYIEPITPEFVEKIIQKEKVDAILPTVGGQTALNCALTLEKNGVLKKYGVELIGADSHAIEKAENRQLFNEAMANIGLDVAKNTVVNNLEAAQQALLEIGLPAIIRPSFTLGGSGGGIAYTPEEFMEIVAYGLDVSPVSEVQIDESILGWKEYEMEVIRDKNDNAIIVCTIENLDPMGVHTGDSITVAPSITLTDKEYQRMRNAAIAVLREIGVETGGSNVQFALNPTTGRLIVIEMNPRVSRSSALASKATGFPIAKIAAKLAVGFTLDEIENDITRTTPASFEPVIDYIVTKIPRFAFEKFNVNEPVLSTTMHSVGEIMAIGRSFCESLQKGLYSLETGLTGLNTPTMPSLTGLDAAAKKAAILEAMKKRTPDRILQIGQALREGIDADAIEKNTAYSRWFIEQLALIVAHEKTVEQNGIPQDKSSLLHLKKLGFSDARLAELSGTQESAVRKLRHQLGIHPVYKTVDTCSGEFASNTPYLYSCYEGDAITAPVCEANPSSRKKIIILGSGPNRIGQGIEFDYACVHAAMAFQDEGYEAIMINCNPETVSTDYDITDKLYFEPLTSEHTLEIIKNEQKSGELIGVVVQFGGQTPLKLCQTLAEENIPIIGTCPDKIDLAEDRERFQKLLQNLQLQQPRNTTTHSLQDISKSIAKVGYPVVIRPSNILGGRAMKILHTDADLENYLKANADVLVDGPILIDQFLSQAIEIDVDALCDGQDVVIAGIMQHIEHAGVHSGDSACSLPHFSLSKNMENQIKQSTCKLAKALDVVGLINIQYAVKNEKLYIIEVNPRASRTVPFVAKAKGVSIAGIASKLMIGHKLADMDLSALHSGDYHALKEAVLPFDRFGQAEIKLDTEMRSTGEVMGIDKDWEIAYAKAQMAAGNTIPLSGNVLLDILPTQSQEFLTGLQPILTSSNYCLFATPNTYQHLLQIQPSLEEHITCVDPEKVTAASLPLALVISTVTTKEALAIRRFAHMNRIPYVTSIEACEHYLNIMNTLKSYAGVDIISLQEFSEQTSEEYS